MNSKAIGTTAIIVLLMGAAAAIAAYATKQSLHPDNTVVVSEAKPVKLINPPHVVHAPPQMAAAQPVQPMQPGCDDRNIVGTLAGGAAGGLVGSQIGKGKGNTAAIIGGIAGGALVGNQYIPTRNVTCR